MLAMTSFILHEAKIHQEKNHHLEKNRGHVSAAQSRMIPSLDQLAMLCQIHHETRSALLAPRARCWLMLILLLTKTPNPFLRGCSPASHSPV